VTSRFAAPLATWPLSPELTARPFWVCGLIEKPLLERDRDLPRPFFYLHPISEGGLGEAQPVRLSI